MKLLCAVDGSECSRWGVEALGAIAARPPDQLTLLHVIDTAAIKAATGNHPRKRRHALSAMEQAGKHVLHQMEQAAKTALSQSATAPHTDIRALLVRGPVAQTIARYADRQQADLVLIGSRGLSDVSSFLLGSVSRKVVSFATCPILVVKQPLTGLQRVLLAVDDSKHSRGAVRFLCQQFLPLTAHVTVLSVVEPSVTELASRFLSASQLEEIDRPRRDKAQRLVDAVRQQLLKEEYSVTTDVQTDHLKQTIIQWATKLRADLLVVGSRSLRAAERAQLGSVSEAVLKYAPCSILVVRGWRA